MVPVDHVTLSTIGIRASSTLRFRHGQNTAKGTPASITVLLTSGINSAIGFRGPHAASFNHDTRACVSRASPGPTSSSNTTAMTARRLPERTGLLFPLPADVVAARLRRGRADAKPPVPDHDVAV